MSERADILIIGGGVIGLTTAYFLAREGARVEVIDQGDFGQESSWAGAGILPPGNPASARTPFDQLRAHSAALFPILSAELRERTGIDNGFLLCGGLEFAGQDAHAEAQEWRGEGITVEALDEPAVLRLEPALALGLGGAFHLPDMAQLRNPRHLKALIAGCSAWGVRLRPGCPAHGFEQHGPCVQAVRTPWGRVEAGRFLVAAGAWSGGLLEQVGWRPGIHPVRGQIAMLNTGAPLLRRILLWGARYLVPRPDARVLIGSTEEDAGFEKRTTAGAITELLTLACTLAPGLASAHLERCWAGLRPGSPDGLPFLGPVPGVDNLFVAAGHFRAGIQLSPGSALVLKELLLGQPLTVPLTPFRLDRAATPALRS
ncbi:MAG: glycine oxidase ThiO [Gemmataceae bacterium]|nr:glycine oxidase ThiO [Gemmataceae bacterium]